MATFPPHDPLSAPLPTYPTAAPIQQPGPSGFERFAQVMQAVAPALAMAAAYKQGQLGTFTQNFFGAKSAAEDQRMQQQRYQQQAMMQQHQMQRQVEQDAQEAEDRRLRSIQFEQAQADREVRMQQQAEDRKRDLVAMHLQAIADNPKNNLRAYEEPENFVLDVPGVGRISLAEALQIAPNGKVGVLPEPKPQARVPLVTNDQGVRVADAPGVRVSAPKAEKPDLVEDANGVLVPKRAGLQVSKPSTPRTTTRMWKDDDPLSETFGQQFILVLDAQGNVISTKPVKAPSAAEPASPAGKKADPLGIR